MSDENPTESDMQAIADQLHALATKCESLTQQLVNMTAQRDDAVAALHANAAQHDRDNEEWQQEFRRHLKRSNEASHDATRAKNRFVMLADVAQDVFADFLETYRPFELTALTPEWRQRVKEAREMLAMIERECT